MLVLASGEVVGEMDRPCLQDMLREAILEDSHLQPTLRFDFEEAQSLLGESLMLNVSPAEIVQQLPYTVAIDGKTLSVNEHFIADGDLGTWTGKLEQSRVMAETRELVDADLDYRQTRHYQQRARAMAAGRVRRLQHTDHDSIEKLDRYFENAVRMLRLAQRFGILQRPAPNADGMNGHFVPAETRDLWLELSESNIGIAVDAHGTLLRAGPGKHRTVVAKLLGLPSIPCELRLVHADFLKPFLHQENGDALAAVRSCVRHLQKTQASLIAEADTVSARNAESQLEQLALDVDAVQPRFVFERSQLPKEISSTLLCLAPVAAIRRRLIPPRRRLLEGTPRSFIARGSWRNFIARLDEPRIDPQRAMADGTTLEVWQNCARSAGQALVLREDAVPIVVSAEGELLLWGTADSRLDLARAQGVEQVFAEICLIHIDWLRAAIERHKCGALAAIRLGLSDMKLTPLAPFTGSHDFREIQVEQDH
jgi:hypothetical protein